MQALSLTLSMNLGLGFARRSGFPSVFRWRRVHLCHPFGQKWTSGANLLIIPSYCTSVMHSVCYSHSQAFCEIRPELIGSKSHENEVIRI